MHELGDKTIFITGGTGLIGQTLIRRILTESPTAQILALTRNTDRAKALFQGVPENERIQWIEGDVCTPLTINGDIDYIVHGAAETSSKSFVNDPVRVIDTAITGTANMLKLAVKHSVKKLVYLSTMEVYGAPADDEKIDEKHGCDLDTMQARSSYPESKRLCETLCAAYAAQHDVPACVLRLTQTFGPGVRYDDSRVFAEFARCAIEGRDIILHTKGETARNYLYTEDAASAILTVLLHGSVSEAYNAANESTYCTILEMAELVARECADNRISVRIEEADTTAYGYAPVLHMNLDTSKLRALGWEPKIPLPEMFRNMIAGMTGAGH